MMKQALLVIKEKEVTYTLFVFSLGLLFALQKDILSFPFLLLSAVLIYQKDATHYLLFGSVVLLGGLLIHNAMVIIAIVFLLFDFCCFKGYDVLKLDVFPYMKYWNTVLLFLSSYWLTRDINMALCYAGGCFFLHECSNRKEKEGLFVSFLVGCYLLYVMLQLPYLEYIQILVLCISAFLFSPTLCFGFVLYFYWQNIAPLYLLYFLFLSYEKQKRWLYSFGAILLLFYDSSFFGLYVATLILLFGMNSYHEDSIFMKETEDALKQHEIYQQHSFYRQLLNYSSVFYDLSRYYEDSNRMQASLLHLMGDALEHNARLSKRYFYQKEELEEQLTNLLKGYQFQLEKCQCQRDKKKLRIEMELQHLYENELEDVILPLVSKSSGCKMHIQQVNHYPLQKERLYVVLESDAYRMVETYGASLHVKEVCGDSFHSFQWMDHTICLLSDGMGCGEKAKKASQLLVNIMETMLRCQIPLYECVDQLNRFLRSDVFATLDVLSFDRKNAKAYLSKSASAPTYLYRKNELYEMNAHSLPIGIIDNVKADVYEIEFQEGDIFLMVSDGVEKEEVEKWCALKRCSAVKNEGLNMMNILRCKKRSDDSTILMAKIN